MNKKLQIKIFFGFVLIIVLLIVAWSAVFIFRNPSITGHVPVNIYTQNLNLVINKSQNFLLTSDNSEPFIITSFKISGNIIGDGQVKIYIDTGKGQKFLVYENIAQNIAQKKDTQASLYGITGGITDKSIKNATGENISKDDKWLVIKPIKILLEKEAFDEVSNDESLVKGDFNWQCIETCLIRMEISRKIAYRLTFLVESGTVLKINKIAYQTEEIV